MCKFLRKTVETAEQLQTLDDVFGLHFTLFSFVNIIPMWMIELLLGRLVQLLLFALTTTLYSSPQCRSLQVQEVVLLMQR